jgi:hypothetical protein
VTNKLKASREKGEGIFDKRGPWSGYGEILSNGGLTVEQKEMLSKAEEVKQARIEESKYQELNFEPYSTFHWGKYQDYKGLSYV